MLYRAPDAPGWSASVLLIPTTPGHVLPVGVSALAEEVRRLLAGHGVAGWRAHPLPATHTPLTMLRPHMRVQEYTVLRRHEFSTVEQVALVPAKAWADLRGAGEKFRSKVAEAAQRILSEAVSPAGPTDTSGPAELVGGGVASMLTETALARYPDVVRCLARSGLPENAITTICQSLNAEPVPPSDPLVVMLLQTGREVDLLRVYEATHADPGGVSTPLSRWAEDVASAGENTAWTVELAEEVLRRALPTGSRLLRALIDEGGQATVIRLHELLQTQRLGPYMQTLTTNAAAVLRDHHLSGVHRHFVFSSPDPDDSRRGVAHLYAVPRGLIPTLDRALRNLGR